MYALVNLRLISLQMIIPVEENRHLVVGGKVCVSEKVELNFVFGGNHKFPPPYVQTLHLHILTQSE